MAGSLVFDGDLLARPIAILGSPRVRLRLASDKPQAQIAVRLNAIHKNGAVERVTYGLLNLSHRAGSEKPSPLKPGRFYDVTVRLNEIAQTVPAGCRLRLAISTSYWPMAWPSPELATVTIDPSKSLAEIPVLEKTTGLAKVRFAPAEQSQPGAVTVIKPGAETRHVIHDIDKQRTNFTIKRNDGTYVIDDIGTEITFTKLKDFAVGRADPSGARSVVACTGALSARRLGRPRRNGTGHDLGP